MTIDLSDLNNAFRESQSEKFPDGVYPAKVIKAEVSLSNAGRRQVVWDLEVQNPTTGHTIIVKKYCQLESGIHWLASDLTTLDVALDHINDLHQVLRELTGAMIEIDLELTGNWYMVRFVRLVAKAF